MSVKLLWLGLTLIMAGKLVLPGLPIEIVGELLMIIGAILLVLDK